MQNCFDIDIVTASESTSFFSYHVIIIINNNEATLEFERATCNNNLKIFRLQNCSS
jgi:hypothetical protein